MLGGIVMKEDKGTDIQKTGFKVTRAVDRFIKYLLFVCGSSATIIVFFIIIFLFKEAVPVFGVTSPVDFILEDDWDPIYDSDESVELYPYVEINEYNFYIEVPDDSFFVVPNTNNTFFLDITNIGGSADNYSFSYSGNGIEASIKPNHLLLEPGEEGLVNVTIVAKALGSIPMRLTTISQGGGAPITKEIVIITSESGVDISPDNPVLENYGRSPAQKMTITNTGAFNDTYDIAIEAPSNFSIMVPGISEWNSLTYTGSIDLEPNETASFTLVSTLLTDFDHGLYHINITVTSTNNGDIVDKAVVDYYVRGHDFAKLDKEVLFISDDGNAEFTLCLEGKVNETFEIEVSDPGSDWTVSIYKGGNLVQQGPGKFEQKTGMDETCELTILVTPKNGADGDRADLVINVLNPGTEPRFGAFAFIVATFLVTIGAILIALPLGIGSAIFIAELAPNFMKTTIKSAVELLAGIPSIIYGYFGLVVLAEWIVYFDSKFTTVPLTSGECWLAGSILLAIMSLPTIISVSEDAISSVPREYKEASLGMGATKWQTIKNIVVPSAISGITAATILGIGRAIGETMTVMLVAGSANVIPEPLTNVFSPIMPITAAIGIEMGEASGLHRNALFALGVVLFIMVLLVNSVANFVLKTLKERFNPSKQKKKKFQLSPKMKIYLNRFFLGLVLISMLIVFSTWWGYIVSAILGIVLIVGYFISNKLDAKVSQIFAFVGITFLALLVISALVILIGFIVIKGAPVIIEKPVTFFTGYTTDLGRSGGIRPVIIGTFLLVAGAIIIALPLGIGAGIYLAEYAKEGRIIRIIRMGIDNLNATPSIVFGLFAFTLFVTMFGWGISLIAGQLILGFLILPTIIRTTEEAVKSVPHSFREGSLAVGATKWQTIYKIVLPSAAPGIITGTILSVGRAAGETAPIMFVACTSLVLRPYFKWTGDPISSVKHVLFSPVQALPYHLFKLLSEVHGQEARTNAYGTALVLMLLVLSIYMIAIGLRVYFKRKVKW